MLFVFLTYGWSSMYLGRQSSSSFLHDWKTSPDSKLGKNRRGIGWKTQVCDQLPDWPIVYRMFYVFVCDFVIVFVFVIVAVFLLLQVKKQEFATSFRDWPHLPTPLNISCLIKNLRRLTQNQSLAREQGSGFQLGSRLENMFRWIGTCLQIYVATYTALGYWSFMIVIILLVGQSDFLGIFPII